MDVHEIIRLARMGRARKEIGRLVNASQPTVRKYLAWAETEGLLVGPLPEPAALEQRLAGSFPELTSAQQQSGLTRYTTEIVALREQKVEMAAIRLRLQEQLSLAGGFNRAYVGFVERAERQASIETVARLAAVLGVELHEFFRWPSGNSE